MKDGFGSWLVLGLVMLGVIVLAQLLVIPLLRGIFTKKAPAATIAAGV